MDQDIATKEYRDYIKNHRRGGYDTRLEKDFAVDNDLLLRRISNQLASMIQLMEKKKSLPVDEWTDRDKAYWDDKSKRIPIDVTETKE